MKREQGGYIRGWKGKCSFTVVWQVGWAAGIRTVLSETEEVERITGRMGDAKIGERTGLAGRVVRASRVGEGSNAIIQYLPPEQAIDKTKPRGA